MLLLTACGYVPQSSDDESATSSNTYRTIGLTRPSSYLIPNPVHFHIAHHTYTAPRMRPKLITINANDNKPINKNLTNIFHKNDACTQMSRIFSKVPTSDVGTQMSSSSSETFMPFDTTETLNSTTVLSFSSDDTVEQTTFIELPDVNKGRKPYVATACTPFNIESDTPSDSDTNNDYFVSVYDKVMLELNQYSEYIKSKFLIEYEMDSIVNEGLADEKIIESGMYCRFDDDIPREDFISTSSNDNFLRVNSTATKKHQISEAANQLDINHPSLFTIEEESNSESSDIVKEMINSADEMTEKATNLSIDYDTFKNVILEAKETLDVSLQDSFILIEQPNLISQEGIDSELNIGCTSNDKDSTQVVDIEHTKDSEINAGISPEVVDNELNTEKPSNIPTSQEVVDIETNIDQTTNWDFSLVGALAEISLEIFDNELNTDYTVRALGDEISQEVVSIDPNTDCTTKNICFLTFVNIESNTESNADIQSSRVGNSNGEISLEVVANEPCFGRATSRLLLQEIVNTEPNIDHIYANHTNAEILLGVDANVSSTNRASNAMILQDIFVVDSNTDRIANAEISLEIVGNKSSTDRANNFLSQEIDDIEPNTNLTSNAEVLIEISHIESHTDWASTDAILPEIVGFESNTDCTSNTPISLDVFYNDVNTDSVSNTECINNDGNIEFASNVLRNNLQTDLNSGTSKEDVHIEFNADGAMSEVFDTETHYETIIEDTIVFLLDDNKKDSDGLSTFQVNPDCHKFNDYKRSDMRENYILHLDSDSDCCTTSESADINILHLNHNESQNDILHLDLDSDTDYTTSESDDINIYYLNHKDTESPKTFLCEENHLNYDVSNVSEILLPNFENKKFDFNDNNKQKYNKNNTFVKTSQFNEDYLNFDNISNVSEIILSNNENSRNKSIKKHNDNNFNLNNISNVSEIVWSNSEIINQIENKENNFNFNNFSSFEISNNKVQDVTIKDANKSLDTIGNINLVNSNDEGAVIVDFNGNKTPLKYSKINFQSISHIYKNFHKRDNDEDFNDNEMNSLQYSRNYFKTYDDLKSNVNDIIPIYFNQTPILLKYRKIDFQTFDNIFKTDLRHYLTTTTSMIDENNVMDLECTVKFYNEIFHPMDDDYSKSIKSKDEMKYFDIENNGNYFYKNENFKYLKNVKTSCLNRNLIDNNKNFYKLVFDDCCFDHKNAASIDHSELHINHDNRVTKFTHSPKNIAHTYHTNLQEIFEMLQNSNSFKNLSLSIRNDYFMLDFTSLLKIILKYVADVESNNRENKLVCFNNTNNGQIYNILKVLIGFIFKKFNLDSPYLLKNSYLDITIHYENNTIEDVIFKLYNSKIQIGEGSQRQFVDGVVNICLQSDTNNFEMNSKLNLEKTKIEPKDSEVNVAQKIVLQIFDDLLEGVYKLLNDRQVVHDVLNNLSRSVYGSKRGYQLEETEYLLTPEDVRHMTIIENNICNFIYNFIYNHIDDYNNTRNIKSDNIFQAPGYLDLLQSLTRLYTEYFGKFNEMKFHLIQKRIMLNLCIKFEFLYTNPLKRELIIKYFTQYIDPSFINIYEQIEMFVNETLKTVVDVLKSNDKTHELGEVQIHLSKAETIQDKTIVPNQKINEDDSKITSFYISERKNGSSKYWFNLNTSSSRRRHSFPLTPPKNLKTKSQKISNLNLKPPKAYHADMNSTLFPNFELSSIIEEKINKHEIFIKNILNSCVNEAIHISNIDFTESCGSIC